MAEELAKQGASNTRAKVCIKIVPKHVAKLIFILVLLGGISQNWDVIEYAFSII